MKRYLALALMLALMLGTFAACGDRSESSESEESVQVGIVLPTRAETRWLQDETAFTAAMEDAGFTAEVMFSEGSTAVELSNVDELVEKGVRVLVLCAADANAAGSAVQTAKDAGATVICYDRMVTGIDAVDYYAGFDPYAVGVAQGRYLVEKYAGKNKVPLYLYAGASEDNDALLSFSGAWSVLSSAVQGGQFEIQNCPAAADFVGKELDAVKNHNDLEKILETISTKWDADTTKKLVAANLKAGKKGDVAILAPNDDTARTIADAFSADSTVKNYEITGQGADAASLKYIQEGKQSMTVWKNTATLAKTTCDMVGEILGGGTPAADTTYNNKNKDVPSVQAEIVVVDKAKLDELIANGDFSQADIDSAK